VFLNQWFPFQIWFAKLFWVGQKMLMLNWWIYYTFLLSLQYTSFIPLHVPFFTPIFICDSWCRKHGHNPSLFRSSDTFRTTAVLSNGMQCISSLGCRIQSQIFARFKPTRVIIFATVHKVTHFTEYQNYCYGLLLNVAIFFSRICYTIHFACVFVSFIVSDLRVLYGGKHFVTFI
jgi:hypothetical protein